ncbi:MAG TPA: PQQ-dependent sugar dehydrogenase, partial [Solirubrobacteraceae bacterium]|nr:PQQ-dependent sugar dehydrogenase [Solirubrobacteraceae bacterium]
MRGLPLLVLLLLLAGCGSSSSGAASTTTAQAAPTTTAAKPAAKAAARGVRLRSIGRFSAPIYVTAPPGDTHRLFVVQRGGSVVALRDGRRAGTFLRVSTTTDGERGLLYVYYTAPSGEIRVDEFRANPNANRVDPGSQRNVLSIPHPENNHNGGQLAFSPDGLLYIGVGDGGSEGDPHRYGQNLGVLYGKILRIDPRPGGGSPYTVPDSN